MRNSRVKKNNEPLTQPKIALTRSTSSISAQFRQISNKSPDITKQTLRPSYSEAKKTPEKNSSTDLFTLDSSNICKNCCAPKDCESKIFSLLNEIHSNLSTIVSAYQSWNNAQTPKFQANLYFNSEFYSGSEISKKLQEISSICVKINEIFNNLTTDLSTLAKTSPWKNVTLRKPAPAGVAFNLQESLEKAQNHLKWLKGHTGVNFLDQSEDVAVRCLQMDLIQSWRDRRVLEVKLAATDKNSPDCVLKTIERILVDGN